VAILRSESYARIVRSVIELYEKRRDDEEYHAMLPYVRFYTHPPPIYTPLSDSRVTWGIFGLLRSYYKI
jgi:hypothetical protein